MKRRPVECDLASKPFDSAGSHRNLSYTNAETSVTRTEGASPQGLETKVSAATRTEGASPQGLETKVSHAADLAQRPDPLEPLREVRRKPLLPISKPRP